MSVKASDRKPSKMQFEVLANEVRDDVSRVLTNKRLVEPKWKYIIAVPGVQMAELICWYIKAANFIWPKDETALMARRELQYKAIGACGALADFLFWALRMLDGLYNKLFVIPKITRPITGGKKHEHRVYHR